MSNTPSLTPGSTVRYARLGSGTVMELTTRKFGGEEKDFAVIELPHQDMTVQLPINDDVVRNNLHNVMDEEDLRYLIKHMEVRAEPLPRTWDAREQEGKEVILKGGPEEWITLYSSYSVADGSGVKVASSDKTIVESLRELLSAELCCSAGIPYEEATRQIASAYNDLSSLVDERGAGVTHFAGVKTEIIVRDLASADAITA